MDDLLRDNRFAHIPKDPRFRQMKREERKVKIDKRFRGMFQDKRFKLKYSVDKRGRPIHTSTNENLKNYYELSSSESEESSEESEEENEQHSVDESPSKTREKSNKTNKKHKSYDANDKESSSFAAKKTKPKKSQLGLADAQSSSAQTKLKTNRTDKAATKSKPSLKRKNVQSQKITPAGSSTDDDDEEEEEEEEEEGGTGDEAPSSGDEESELDSEEEAPAIKESTSGLGPDYARGEAVLESSSSDDEDDGDEDEELDHGWGELDKEAPEAENVTRRLAVCNMDWDRIKANDLLVLFNSFKPTGGVIHSVKIYPSEFGQQRMAEEAVKGPTELVTRSETEGKKVDSENVEGEHYHREKLRQYQLNRLKYYYAVMECDSPKTANHIYEECDGMEYESSATKLDLRFIPDEMVFDQEPKSVAQEVPDVSTYKPSLFTTSALQQSKVDLTWDETDRDRVTVTMRKFDKDELEEMDVKAYLASDSDVEEDPYGDLVADDDFGHISEEEDDDAQIQKYRQLLLGGKASKTTSKADGEEDKDMEMEITWEPGLKETTEELVKKKAKQKDGMTPWEEYLEKKKEKKMKKKEEQDKKKKQKGNSVEESEKNLPHSADDASESEEELPAGIDLNDPYFRDELEGNEPTAKKSESKSGKGSSSGTKKKKKRAKGSEDKGKPEDQDELSLLLMDEDDQKQHFSLKAIMEQESEGKQKKKRKKKKKQAAAEEKSVVKDTFQVDVKDDRFLALFEDPHYNIDPSAPEFKKTKAMESLISEKQQRRERKREKPVETSRSSSSPAEDAEVASKKAKLVEESSTAEVKQVDSTQRTKDPALANLIKSVKAKTQTLQEKKKKKKAATFRPK